MVKYDRSVQASVLFRSVVVDAIILWLAPFGFVPSEICRWRR